MLDPETFLIELSVLADEFGKQERQPERSPGRSRGPAPALTQAEIVTLALFSQWQQFPSEACYRSLSDTVPATDVAVVRGTA